MSVPRNLKFDPITSAIPAKSKVVNMVPDNGATYSYSTSNVIRIPVRASGFLDGQHSYLRFTLKNKSTATDPTHATAKTDSLCSSVFNRIVVKAGAVTLSDISHHNVLVEELIKIDGSDDLLRQLTLTSDGTMLEDSLDAGLTGASTYGMATNTSKTFILPMVNNILNQDKYIPIGYMGANNLTIELYLEQPSRAFIFNNGFPTPGLVTDYEITQVNYVATVIEVDPGTDATLRTVLAEKGLEIHCKDYQAHLNSIPLNTPSATISIADRSQVLCSLTTLFVRSQNRTNSSNIQPYRWGNNKWQYKIGGDNFPQQAVNVDSSLVEAYAELQKAHGSIFNLNNTTLLTKTKFGNTGSATGVVDTKLGGYAVCYSFENFKQASGAIESGMNTSKMNMPISLELNWDTNAVSEDLYAITFACKDVIYRLMPDSTMLVSA